MSSAVVTATSPLKHNRHSRRPLQPLSDNSPPPHRIGRTPPMTKPLPLPPNPYTSRNNTPSPLHRTHPRAVDSCILAAISSKIRSKTVNQVLSILRDPNFFVDAFNQRIQPARECTQISSRIVEGNSNASGSRTSIGDPDGTFTTSL